MLSSYASGTSTRPLLGDTIGAQLDATAVRVGPDHEALVECGTGRRFSYAELVGDVDACALGLDALGVRKGDRVGIWAPSCAEWVIVQLGTARIGAILVNLNPAHRTHDLVRDLMLTGVSVLVVAGSVPIGDGAIDEGAIARLRSVCPDLREVITIGDPSWTSLLAAGRRVDHDLLTERQAQLSADDPINIQLTTGPAGDRRGATLSHHNLVNNAHLVGAGCGYTPADRICLPVPLHHCFGMGMGTLAAFTHGATMIIPAPRFDPARTLQAVQDERCTSLYGVPAMFAAQLDLPDFSTYDLSSLRTGIMAGSPCPPEVMERVVGEMGMTEVTIAYGLTETSPVCTQTRPGDSIARRTSTVGRVHPHLEIKIIDPATGLTVPRGESGELCVRGYAVMLGYWDDPNATAAALDDARWMHTGDLAEMDEAGYLTIVGRVTDTVVRGGQDIRPYEIEEFLQAHPDVVDVRVIGVPDERFGEELMAWIRLRPEADALDAAALRSFCHGKIAHHKIPRYVKVVDDYPTFVSGRIQKVQLRALSVRELGLERADGAQAG